jgi:hypothetical protein
MPADANGGEGYSEEANYNGKDDGDTDASDIISELGNMTVKNAEELNSNLDDEDKNKK